MDSMVWRQLPRRTASSALHSTAAPVAPANIMLIVSKNYASMHPPGPPGHKDITATAPPTSKLLVHKVQLLSCWEQLELLQLPHQHHTSRGPEAGRLMQDMHGATGGSRAALTAVSLGGCGLVLSCGCLLPAAAAGGVGLHHAQEALHASDAVRPHLATAASNKQDRGTWFKAMPSWQQQ